MYTYIPMCIRIHICICTYLCTCVYTCHSLHMEVRGQLAGIHSLFLLCESWGTEHRSSDLATSHLLAEPSTGLPLPNFKIFVV